MWMIAGRHCTTTNSWADTHVAFSPSFSDFDIAMFDIPNLTDRRVAGSADQANLARRKPYLCILAFLSKQLS
jgi:hypothetical protein